MRELLVACALAMACSAPAPPPPVKPHVVVKPAPPPSIDAAPADAPTVAAPERPTLRLPRNFTPTGYEVRLAIDPGKPTFAGSVTITGDVKEASQVIWLHGRHLTIERATAAGPGNATISVTPSGEDLLEVRAEPALEPGTWQLTFDYTGEIDRLNTTGMFAETAAGATYVYTQLEATYARRVLPCIDEPDVKVPWHLTLDIPEKLVAVSNSSIAQETVLGDGKKRVEFARTKPLPSYLVALAVGPFDVVDGGKTKSGLPVRVITLKGRAADAAYAAKSTPRIVDALEDWFGMPFPYDKLDVVAVPLTFGFSAMENAGMVTYTESLILFDATKASLQRKHIWTLVAAHELSHQWFGDFVTMAWWDDLWLNEGFADWLAPKIAARVEPAWHDDLDVVELRTSALDADSLVSARRVRQPIESEDDIVGAFDLITYRKGASLLAMFEQYVGAEPFQRGVRAYLKARAYSNATSADFAAAISTAAGKDLGAAFSSFLDQAGAPELDATLACAGGPPHVELAQHRYVPPGSPVPEASEQPWIAPVCVAYERAGKRAEACGVLDKPRGTIVLAGKTCPRWVMPNVGGRGYYRVHLAAPQVTALRDEAWPQLTWAERSDLFFEVGTEMANGALPLQLALSFVPKMLAGGDRFAIGDAVALPLDLEPFVADEQRGKYEAAMRALFAPGATKLGPLPKDSDDLDAELVRGDLYRSAAWHGRDPDLVRQASELAGRWRDLPHAMRGTILDIAADASPDLYERLLHDVKTETDRTRREQIWHALGTVRDPQRLATALPLVLDKAVDGREAIELLQAASNEATRAVAEKFLRDHLDAVLARLPKDEVVSGAASIVYVITDACDGKRRTEITEFTTKHFGSLPGGERVVKQALERMDQCIARRSALDTEIRAWLGGFRLPRPESKSDAKKAKPKAKSP